MKIGGLSMDGSNSVHNPMLSDFADDPSMVEIIAEFAINLQNQVSLIEASVREQDADRVRRIAHQLKGVAGGYGFPTISQAADQVEQMMDPNGEAELELQRAASHINTLVKHCQSVVGTPPVASETKKSH